MDTTNHCPRCEAYARERDDFQAMGQRVERERDEALRALSETARRYGDVCYSLGEAREDLRYLLALADGVKDLHYEDAGRISVIRNRLTAATGGK
jgi:hypothetical protein